MTSNDNVITIEMFNAGIQEIKSEFNQRFDKIETEIRVNTIKIEAVQNSVNWSFAGATIVITAVIAIVGLVATLAPTIREYFASKQKNLIEERDLRAMMREEIRIAQSAAVAGK